MTTKRLLLVEFTTVDRFHCAIMFPYLKGAAMAAGCETRWLRFAMKASATMEQDGAGVPLERADLEALRAAVDDLQADRVLFGHRPAAEVVEAVAGAGAEPAQAYLASFDESDGSEAGGCRRVDEHGALVWLGLDPAQIRMPEGVDADFGWAPGNELAARARPLPFLLCGPECRYSRPVEKNPAFAGVDLSGCADLTGCTFCRGARETAPWGVAPMEMARRNLEAIRQTHPRWTPHRPRYRLTGEEVFFQVDRLARLVLELELTPCDLLLDARADSIARHGERLEQAAAALAGSGHVLHICLVGLESFSAPELLRMNKGQTATRLVQAVDLLQRLEAEHSGSFALREYGGFSTILYTPWTTIDDLKLNLEMVSLFGLEPLCGKLLTSRLRLYPDLPLARLARRDGLLVQAYEDPALDTARRNFYPGETPWRFAHQEVELINRVTTRLQPDAALDGDALYGRVQDWLAAQPVSGAVKAARHLVSALEADPEIRTVEQLLEAATAMARGQRRPVHMVVGAETMATEDILLEQKWTPASAMMRLGRKPVRKEEPLTRRQVEELRAGAGDHLPNLRFRRRRRTRDGEHVHEMFYGADAALVDETCELADRLEDPERYLEDKPALAARIGVLLGYPRCCSEAFARESLAGWERNEWIHLARRLETQGPVPSKMNPFQHLFFVPCKADCEAALELVDQIMEDRLRHQVGADRQRWEEDARQPVLFLHNRPGQFVQLHPLEPPRANRIRYRAGRRAGDDPRLEAVLQGDTLEVHEGRITVLQGGQPLRTFALEAAIWWHERAFHPEFWRPVVQRLMRSGQAEGDGGGAAAAPVVADERQPIGTLVRRAGELDRWASRDELVDAVALAWSLCGGEAGAEVEEAPGRESDNTLRLAAGRGDERVVLRVEGRRMERRGGAPLVHYDLFTEPAGRVPARGDVVRVLATLLDCRTRHLALSDDEADLARLAAGSPLQRRVEKAALLMGRAGARVAWPTTSPEGTVLLSLRQDEAWLDLYLEQRRAGARYFLVTSKTAISHFAHSPVDARGERLVHLLARALKRIE